MEISTSTEPGSMVRSISRVTRKSLRCLGQRTQLRIMSVCGRMEAMASLVQNIVLMWF